MILVFWGPNFSWNSNGNTPTGALNARGYEKVAISDQYLAIARKRWKIDGYMLRYVWQALNSLSIHVTFTAIVTAKGVPRVGQNVQKIWLIWRTFKLTGWITRKRLKICGYMQRCVLQALNPLSNRVTFTTIVPGAYPGEAKMCKKMC